MGTPKRTYTIPSWLGMSTPRVERGQTVSSDYGIDFQQGVAVRRTHDRGDGSTKWAIADLSNREMDRLASYRAGGTDGAPVPDRRFRPVTVRFEECHDEG